MRRCDVKLIAHRGGAGLRVENTLAAFANAIGLSADGAELDVHLTRDEQVVVHHDHRLNGGYCRDERGEWLTPEQGPAIADLTWGELQRYEIGVPDPDGEYAKRFDRIEPVLGQRIPLLRDVIRLAKSRSPRFRLVIEIKASMLTASRKLWRPLVDATLAVIDDEDFADRSILCSFDWGALLYAKRRRSDMVTWFTSSPLSWLQEGTSPDEDLPVKPRYLEAIRALRRDGDAPWFAGFDPRRFTGGYPEAITAAGGDAWLMYHRDYTQERRRELVGHGLDGVVWSVDLRDEVELKRLVRDGARTFILDYPDVDLEALSGNCA